MQQYAIRFVSINPSQLSASSLASLIKKYEAAVMSEYRQKEGKTEHDDSLIVALTSIESNCTFLKFFIPIVLSASASFVSSIPLSGYSSYANATKSSREFIQEVFTINKVHNTVAELIRVTDNNSEIISTVTQDDSPLIAQHYYSSITTLYGKVTMVGGKTRAKVRLTLDSGQLISCSLKEDKIVYDAAALLYKKVIVTGIASYLRNDEKSHLTDFEIDTITEFKPLGPLAFIKKLSPLAKTQISRIDDIEGFFARLRGDDNE